MNNTEKGGKIKKKKFNRDQEAKNNSALNLSSIFITSEPCKAASSLHRCVHVHTHTSTGTHPIYYLCSHMCQMLQATEDSK